MGLPVNLWLPSFADDLVPDITAFTVVLFSYICGAQTKPE